MHKKIADFLSRERVCVLSVLLPEGQIHSAPMHYSYSPDPFLLYFSTDIASRKCLGLQSPSPSIPAAITVGFSEQDWLTLQLSGHLRQLTHDKSFPSERMANIKTTHYARNPSSAKYADAPGTVFLELAPSWYRYTDFNSHPPLIIENQ